MANSRRRPATPTPREHRPPDPVGIRPRTTIRSPGPLALLIATGATMARPSPEGPETASEPRASGLPRLPQDIVALGHLLQLYRQENPNILPAAIEPLVIRLVKDYPAPPNAAQEYLPEWDRDDRMIEAALRRFETGASPLLSVRQRSNLRRTSAVRQIALAPLAETEVSPEEEAAGLPSPPPTRIKNESSSRPRVLPQSDPEGMTRPRARSADDDARLEPEPVEFDPEPTTRRGPRTAFHPESSRRPASDTATRRRVSPQSDRTEEIDPMRGTPAPEPRRTTASMAGIEHIVTTAVRTAMATALQYAQTAAPPATNPHGGLTPRNIGFFDPGETQGGGDALTRDDKMIYRDVFSFTRRLRVYATSYGATVVQRMIPRCLLGRANRWYVDELSDATRSRLDRTKDGVEEWCDLLEGRFRDPPSQSLARLREARYTVQDARNHRDPAAYVQDMVTAARNSRVARTENEIVIMAYDQIDTSLRLHLPEITDSTTLEEFLRVLNRKKVLWFEHYGAHGAHAANRRSHERGKSAPNTSNDHPRQPVPPRPYLPRYGYYPDAAPIYPPGYMFPPPFPSRYQPQFPYMPTPNYNNEMQSRGPNGGPYYKRPGVRPALSRRETKRSPLERRTRTARSNRTDKAPAPPTPNKHKPSRRNLGHSSSSGRGSRDHGSRGTTTVAPTCSRTKHMTITRTSRNGPTRNGRNGKTTRARRQSN